MCDPQTTQALGRITQTLGDIRDTQVEHGQTLVRLDERSIQQEKRLDRTYKKSLLSGGGAGAAIAGTFLVVKAWFTGN